MHCALSCLLRFCYSLHSVAELLHPAGSMVDVDLASLDRILLAGVVVYVDDDSWARAILVDKTSSIWVRRDFGE